MFNNVGDAASRSESKISRAGRGLAAVGKVAARGLAVGIGAAGVAMFKFVGDARESERISRITASQIKATGKAANVTADQVGDLALSISNKTGIDDEQIQANANLLLSFRNIRNEVGKGNDIFNQATAVTQDLATVMETDSKSAALQLGKALNDPIKGVTALGRAGVQFTDQQKEQIKTLVESGRTLDAQKLIMAELAGQVGGAAAAAGDPIDKLKTILGNLGETIGVAVLPYVNRVATAVGGFVSEMIEGQGAGGRFRDIMSRVGEVVGTVGRWIMGTAVPAFKQLAGFVRAEVLPRLQDFARFITGTVAPVVGRVLTGALAGARSALASVRGAVERNRPTLESMLATFRQVANFVLTKVVPVLGPVLRAALTQIGRNIAITVDAVSLLWKVFQTAARIIQGTIERILAVVRIGRQMYQAGRDLVLGFINGIKSLAGAALSAAQDLASDALNAVKSKLKIFSPSRETIKLGGHFSTGFAEGIRKGSDKAVDAVKGMVEKVAGRLDELKTRARDVASGVADSVRGIVDVSAIGAPVVAGQDAEGNDIMRTPSLQETFGQFSAQAQQFAGALAEMARKKLAPSIIAAVAAAGPASGLTAAQALASGSAAEVASVNASIGAVERFARQTSDTVVKTTPLPDQIKREERQLDKLQQILEATKAEKVAKVTVEGDKLVVLIEREQKKNRRRG